MQDRIRKDGIKLRIETQRRGIADARVHALAACIRHLFGAGIDADQVAAKLAQEKRKSALAASEIQDTFTGFRCQKLEHRPRQFGHK